MIFLFNLNTKQLKSKTVGWHLFFFFLTAVGWHLFVITKSCIALFTNPILIQNFKKDSSIHIYTLKGYTAPTLRKTIYNVTEIYLITSFPTYYDIHFSHHYSIDFCIIKILTFKENIYFQKQNTKHVKLVTLRRN